MDRAMCEYRYDVHHHGCWSPGIPVGCNDLRVQRSVMRQGCLIAVQTFRMHDDASAWLAVMCWCTGSGPLLVTSFECVLVSWVRFLKCERCGCGCMRLTTARSPVIQLLPLCW